MVKTSEPPVVTAVGLCSEHILCRAFLAAATPSRPVGLSLPYPSVLVISLQWLLARKGLEQQLRAKVHHEWMQAPWDRAIGIDAALSCLSLASCGLRTWQPIPREVRTVLELYWPWVTPHLSVCPVHSAHSLSPFCFFPQIFGAIEEQSSLGFPVGRPGTNLNVSKDPQVTSYCHPASATGCMP